MLHGLLIGEVKGTELNLISDACDKTPICVDYPDAPIFHAQRKSPWPDEQRGVRHMGAVTNANSGVDLQTFSVANSGVDLQTFSVQDQLSNKTLCLLICRQRSILPGEVDLNIRQDFDFIGAPHGSRTVPLAKGEVSAATGDLIPNLSYNSTRPIADVYHASVDVRCKPGRPDYCGGTIFQPKALAL